MVAESARRSTMGNRWHGPLSQVGTDFHIRRLGLDLTDLREALPFLSVLRLPLGVTTVHGDLGVGEIRSTPSVLVKSVTGAVLA